MRRKVKKKSFFDKFSYSTRNTNIFLVVVFLFLLSGLTVGYAVLNNVLSIKGDVAIRPFKDIRITSVTGPEMTNGAYENYNFKYSHDLLVVNGVLPSDQSTLTYTITITNNGNVDMDLIDIINTCNDGNIDYQLGGIKLGDTIKAKSSVTITITLKTSVGSNSSFNSQLQFIFEESYIDITPPKITFNPIANDEWYAKDYTVNVKATDDIAVTSLTYCVTTTSSCTPTRTDNVVDNSLVDIDISESSGTNTICVLASDSSKYGPNSVTVCSNKDNKYYKLDKIAPTINPTLSGTLGNNGWYKSDVVINPNGSDTLSQYKGHKYQTSTDNGINYSTWGDYITSNITISNECVNNKIKIKGYDNVLNNSSTYTSNTIKIDKTAPVITVDNHTSNYSVDYEIPLKKTCIAKNGAISYEYGTEYTCDPGDGKERTFYVLDSNDDEVSLIMDRNIGGNVAWINQTDYEKAGGTTWSSGTDQNIFGPITANNYLNNVTKNWKNVTTSLPTGKQIAIAGGDTEWNNDHYTGKVLSSWLYQNLNCQINTCTEIVLNDISNTGTTSGYWTSAPLVKEKYGAWGVLYDGGLNGSNVSTDDYRGVRPVITINKSDVAEKPEYTAPSGFSNDNCSGSRSVTTSGSVNPKALGSYPIKYTSTDDNGNSKTLTLTVNVKDTKAPIIKYRTKGNITNNISNEPFTMILNVIDSNSENSNTSYLYCISTDGNNCTPNIVGTNLTYGEYFDTVGQYKMCAIATDSIGNSSGIVCSDSYKFIFPVYEDGTLMYYNPVTNELNCSDYTPSNSLSENKTGCMKWYIFNDEESNAQVNMLLDHSTTYNQEWNNVAENQNGPITLLEKLRLDTSSWHDSLIRNDSYIDPLKGYTIDYSGYKARLIEANEIAKIIGTTEELKWDSRLPYGTTVGSQTSWFYFDGKGSIYKEWQTQVTNNTNKSNYAWLFDYTYDCASYGCNIVDNGTDGYYTSSASARSFDSAWFVNFSDSLHDYYDVTITYRGIRPVITIPKSMISA